MRWFSKRIPETKKCGRRICGGGDFRAHSAHLIIFLILYFVFCILISILFLFFYFVVGVTPTPCARRPAIRRRAARHPQELRARPGGSPRLVRGTQPSQLRHSYELVLLRHRPLGGGALSSSHRRHRAMPPPCSRATCNASRRSHPDAGVRRHRDSDAGVYTHVRTNRRHVNAPEAVNDTSPPTSPACACHTLNGPGLCVQNDVAFVRVENNDRKYPNDKEWERHPKVRIAQLGEGPVVLTADGDLGPIHREIKRVRRAGQGQLERVAFAQRRVCKPFTLS